MREIGLFAVDRRNGAVSFAGLSGFRLSSREGLGSGLAGFLLYVCLKNRENWFLSFAFPVTGIAGILTLLGVAIFRYIRQGRLRLLGLYLVLIGTSFMLIEFFQHITFGTPMWVWSLYCVCAFGALGLFLFIATLIPPLHAYLRKVFFF